MNTDDRALANLIARLRAACDADDARHDGSLLKGFAHHVKSADLRTILDRLEAFHAKPNRDDIECDVRIAIWNAGMKGGMGQNLSQAFIVRAMAEPTMIRALAALQSPPPVVSGKAKMIEAADYLISLYERLWKGGVVCDLAEAKAAYANAKTTLEGVGQ